jgi:hypothetical protein
VLGLLPFLVANAKRRCAAASSLVTALQLGAAVVHLG